MALILKKLYHGYSWVVNDLRDPRIDGYPTFSTPFYLVGIVAVYLFLVKYALPKFMKNRPPYDLRKILVAYDAFQILGNFYIFYYGIPKISNYSLFCNPLCYSSDPEQLYIIHLGMVYYCLKILDLLDTVFFILRKSYRQVTFLHVYHHSGMVILTWLGLRYVTGGHSVWLPFINSIVHVFMFSYYLLTTFNNDWKNNVTLKKFITQIQMVQFALLIIIYGSATINPYCNFTKLAFFIVIQNVFMIVLFGDFYRKNYLKKKAQ